MDEEKLRERFEDKYERLLGISYQQWLETAPDTEDEAYQRLDQINAEIEVLLDAKDAAVGDARSDIEDRLEYLRTEYAIIEEMFGLELHDR